MFRVEELDCATEENELRDVLTPLNGVRRLDFDLVRPPGERHPTTALTGPDRSRQPQRRDTTLLIATPSESATRRPSLVRSTIVTTAVAGLLAGSEVCVVAGLDERSILVAVLAVAAIALGGRETLRKGCSGSALPSTRHEPADAGHCHRRNGHRTGGPKEPW